MTTNIILYDEIGKVVSYGQLVINNLSYSNVTIVNKPYYAGSSTTEVNQSDNVYIKSVLYEHPLVWSTNQINTGYQTNALETIIT